MKPNEKKTRKPTLDQAWKLSVSAILAAVTARILLWLQGHP